MSIKGNLNKKIDNVFDEEINLTKSINLKNEIQNNKYKLINFIGIIINLILILILIILSLKTKKELLKYNKLNII